MYVCMYVLFYKARLTGHSSGPARNYVCMHACMYACMHACMQVMSAKRASLAPAIIDNFVFLASNYCNLFDGVKADVLSRYESIYGAY